MNQRKFIKCLNKQKKIFNWSIGAVVGGGISLFVFGLAKGLLWGIGASAIGFGFGNWFSSKWHKGNIQRALYWNMPFAKGWLSKNIPESSEIDEL